MRQSRLIAWCKGPAVFLAALSSWLVSCDNSNSSLREFSSYPSATVSLGITETSERRICLEQSRIGKPIPSPQGSFWQKSSADGWCEFQHGTLVRSWIDATQSTAQRTLILKNGRAFLAQRLPTFTAVDEHDGEACADRELVRRMRKAVPDFRLLKLCQQTIASDKRITYKVLKTSVGYVPVLVFEPADIPAKVNLVYLFGGPYNDPFRAPERLSSLSHVVSLRSVRTIVPLYLGVLPIYVEGRNNFDIAAEQITEVIKQIRSTEEFTCSIGGSLGGYLLATVDIPRVKRLLVSPLLDSPRHAIGRMSKSSDFRDPVFHLREISFDQWTEGEWKAGADAQVRRSDAFLLFFGQRTDVPLADQLGVKHSPVSLIYGSKDKTIGLGSLPDVVKVIGATHVRNIGQVGHAFDDADNMWAFEGPIEQFLSACGEARGNVSKADEPHPAP